MLNEPSQGPAPTPFPFRRTEVTHLDISGGTWHNVEGNSFTLNHCKVVIARDGQILQASPVSPTRPHSHVTSDSGADTKASQTIELSSTSRPRLPLSASPPSAEFLIAMSKLEDINQLIAPHTDAIGIFKRVEPYLRDLTVLVGFAATAYTACGSGTLLGNIVRASIDTRMKRCNSALSQLLRQIGWLPHRSFPCTRYAYSIVHEWWTGNEPEEIRTIRLSISEEVRAIGEWLRCVHSFWWASSQLLTMNSTFSMENLREFLESGPIPMLHQIVVEEITFLEPLQGKCRSIPIRFVESFEDIHLAIGMACHGTAASRFIEQRQYQLDESTTDATISERDLLQHIDTCRLFEITITFSRLEVSANVCPRCEASHDDGNRKNDNRWLVCHHCGTKFNAYTSTPVAAKIEKVDQEKSQTKSISGAGVASDAPTISESMTKDCKDEEMDIHDELWASDAKMAKLFRRIKFEVQTEIGLNNWR
ncbi:hypothetical protein BKA70DRAFT_437194 [Coprinopsis sp. MPI-PUGE-AT-0042]|nr:hypothetical protein BKA70DRAFT_437194 [Coprinopsis sp. MPI-PUGE-AT-0042]